ncbi:transposase [Phormidium sp. FACHB-592]|uniref:Transposase n=1 Tax=Stenomitos frigidus AS-A4 TaxID=2933935 RepID=A0ABV0KF26_9CYAN|nr:RNA-guided endonuclease TnpB family protein [Phormidium sp. FACHB-592]MBD2076286.1 transposase [Phormidium sp. FACHB-592]
MRTTYQYRLRPTAPQQAVMDQWLEKLRHQYNWLLSERFQWWEEHRCPVNACPLVCHLPQLKNQPDCYSQQRSLVPMKQARPWYKEVYAQVLQDMVKRVKLAFDRYLKGDSNGTRSGRPRFKGKGRYRSFTYPQASLKWVNGKAVNLPKIGKVKLILHRPLPDGFKLKTATIIYKAGAWYVSLSLEDKLVPSLMFDSPTPENTVGIDVGLKSFLVTSDGEEVIIPQFYRKAEKRLKRLQRQLSKKKKASNRCKKAVKRVAKVHRKITNQRKDFHYKTAKKLLSQGKSIGHESLNIKGLTKTRMAKSINDAGWGQFLQILSIKAERAGLLTIAVNPNGTSQDCSSCGVKVLKTLQDRWHNCSECGCSLDRDHNAAINVQKRAVGHPVQAL